MLDLVNFVFNFVKKILNCDSIIVVGMMTQVCSLKLQVIYKMSDIDLAIIRNTTDCKSDELRNSMRDVALNIQIPTDHQDDIDTEADGPFFVRV